MDEVRELLESALKKYYHSGFIEMDPVSIPHQYSLKQDIEISAFWTAILAWGQRTTIINKSQELFKLMDNAPYDFIVNHKEADRQRFLDFKHRTFQTTDTLYFLEFLQSFYKNNESLETAFFPKNSTQHTVEEGLNRFHKVFFNHPFAPDRTRKHIAFPQRKSTCKRLNMFLRWMVRKDDMGIDFGLWTAVSPDKLMIPFDIHVANVSRRLNLLKRKQNDWRAVLELTERLKKWDPVDPIKYDYALFSLGVNQK